jgi:alkanesulfonate monooxygenase SsuD/methylene tetrahydromethanopterin reductase-like flavin-dependent oxidoreductase (luciferase family)
VELAARHADTVALGGMMAAELARKREWMRAAAGDRADDIALSLTVFAMPEDDAGRRAMAEGMARWNFDLEAMIAAGSPRVLTGSPAAKTEQLRQRREALGVSYVVTSDERELVPVIPLLDGR